MLKLPDVTLVMIETREHELARMALEETEIKADFGDVLVFTDRPALFASSDRRVIEVPDWPEKLGWSQCFWYEVAPHVRTSHVLGIQWDSWIIGPENWRNEFLNYDYIGAPWWHENGLNVGNGGFSLRSTTLMRYVRKYRRKYVCDSCLDDALYCKQYRPALEADGFVWATQKVAEHFAFELVDPPHPTFGFHGAFNFPKLLSLDQLVERVHLMSQSPGIFGSRIWESLCRRLREKHPDILRQLSDLCDSVEQPLAKEN